MTAHPDQSVQFTCGYKATIVMSPDRDEMTYFSDVRLASLQAHIQQAIADNHLPALQAEQFRAHLARVIAARDRMANHGSVAE